MCVKIYLIWWRFYTCCCKIFNVSFWTQCIKLSFFTLHMVLCKLGQKGIGFKSVFRVTDAPEIHSNGFHMQFDVHSGPLGYILPHWVDTDQFSDDRWALSCSVCCHWIEVCFFDMLYSMSTFSAYWLTLFHLTWCIACLLSVPIGSPCSTCCPSTWIFNLLFPLQLMLINFVFFKFYTKLSVSCACVDVCDCVLYCVKLDNGDTSAAEAWDEAAGSIKNTGSKVPWHSAIIASLSAPSPQHYDLQPGVCVCALCTETVDVHICYECHLLPSKENAISYFQYAMQNLQGAKHCFQCVLFFVHFLWIISLVVSLF